jgi:hypothetical protein
VLTLVILAAVGFLMLQKYLVYDDSGKPHLQLAQQTAAAETASRGGVLCPAGDSESDH